MRDPDERYRPLDCREKAENHGQVRAFPRSTVSGWLIFAAPPTPPKTQAASGLQSTTDSSAPPPLQCRSNLVCQTLRDNARRYRCHYPQLHERSRSPCGCLEVGWSTTYLRILPTAIELPHVHCI